MNKSKKHSKPVFIIPTPKKNNELGVTGKTLIILGISAGFASVFGTPLAGAVFALEVVYFSKINLKSILLSFIVAYAAYFTVEIWQVKHTHYSIPLVPEITATILFYTLIIFMTWNLV